MNKEIDSTSSSFGGFPKLQVASPLIGLMGLVIGVVTVAISYIDNKFEYVSLELDSKFDYNLNAIETSINQNKENLYTINKNIESLKSDRDQNLKKYNENFEGIIKKLKESSNQTNDNLMYYQWISTNLVLALEEKIPSVQKIITPIYVLSLRNDNSAWIERLKKTLESKGFFVRLAKTEGKSDSQAVLFPESLNYIIICEVLLSLKKEPAHPIDFISWSGKNPLNPEAASIEPYPIIIGLFDIYKEIIPKKVDDFGELYNQTCDSKSYPTNGAFWDAVATALN